MTAAEYRSAVKKRVDIDEAVTTFDTYIDDFVTQSVRRLYPLASEETAPDTVTITVNTAGEAEVTFTAIDNDDVRMVEVYDGAFWFPVDLIYRHGNTIRLRGLNTNCVQAKLYGLKAYATTTVPQHLELAVIWYAMSQFYDFVAGNKRKYNVYMQNGGSSVDDMRQQSDYYEAKADDLLKERATIYGAQ